MAASLGVCGRDCCTNLIAPRKNNIVYGLDKQSVVVTADGKDIAETVEKAVAWLTEYSF